MEKQTDGAWAADPGVGVTRLPRQRKPLRRSIILLVVTTAALAAFILALGDVRRKRTALVQAERYAIGLKDRVTEAGLLPLNLRLTPPAGQRTKTYAVKWLAREDARVLRRSSGRLIVAQTVPIYRYLARDGRAVIFFEKGRFRCGWLTVSQFDELAAAQREEVRRRATFTESAATEAP